MLETRMHTLHEAICRKFKERQSPSPQRQMCASPRARSMHRIDHREAGGNVLELGGAVLLVYARAKIPQSGHIK